MFTSQRYIDSRTGEIVTQIPLSQIQHFEEYDGPLQEGDVDRRQIGEHESLADAGDTAPTMPAERPVPFKIGQRISVSNGKPRPPERFNRKLAEWKWSNFTGVIKDIVEPRDEWMRGALIIEPDGSGIPGVMTYHKHVRIGSTNIEVIE